MKKINFFKRVVWLLLPLLTLFSISACGAAPTVSDLNLGTPLVTENFNSLATCNNTPGNGSTTTTISSQTAYGVFTDGYVGKSASIGFGIFAAEDPFVSKYLKVYGDNSKVSGLYLNNTSISATGSFDIYFSKTSVGYFGLFSAVDNSNTSNKSYNVVYFYWNGTTLSISDGNTSSHTWQPVGTPTSDLIRVTVVYNSGSNTTYCGTAISISSAKAHVYINGTAVMNGESPKEFTIPTSRNPYYFRVTTNSSNGLSIDDLKIYNGLPTQGSMTVTYNANGKDGGGAAPTDGTAYSSGATVTVLGNPNSMTRTGCTFDGWATAADGTGTSYAAGDEFSISANTTLYAKWAATVTWVVNGTTARTDNIYVPAAGKSVTPPSDPTTGSPNCGDKFMGWTTTNIGSTGIDKSSTSAISALNLFTGAKNVTGNATFYAVFADYAE